MDTAPLNIVEYVEDRNLRGISWNQNFLEGQKQAFKLKHQEAVLYVNKARDRFRIVACFYGLAVLVLPPTDPEQRLSIYLKVSQFLRRMNSFSNFNELIDKEIDHTKERIANRAADADKITKKRGKK